MATVKMIEWNRHNIFEKVACIITDYIWSHFYPVEGRDTGNPEAGQR